MDETIANADLKESDLPPRDAEWPEIISFAMTFDGYDHWGSFDRCAEVGNGCAKALAQGQVLPESLTELRTCLFFEQRRYHHFGTSPEGGALDYIHALIEAIRVRVLAGALQ